MLDGTNGAHRNRWRRGGLFLSALLVAWSTAATAAPRFGRPGLFQVDGSPIAIVALEIDNQPGLDLTTGNEAGEEGPSLSFLFNRGQGSYLTQKPRVLDVQYILHDVATADFTSDDRDDLAVAVTDASALPLQADILVMRNNGRGGFLSPQAFSLTGLLPLKIAAADVTGDGNADVIACHSMQIGAEQQGLISVLPGKGGGGFKAPIEFQVDGEMELLTIAHLDNDNRPDLIVADRDTGKIFILYGNNSGSFFDPPVLLTSVPSPSEIAVVDVDPPSLPDVLVTSYSNGQLYTFRQTANRSFSPTTPMVITQLPSDMGAADFDDDGMTDIVVTSFANATLDLWYGNGVGGFEFGESVHVADTPDHLTIANLNDDDRPDVAISSSLTDTVSVVLQGADVPGSGDASCDGKFDASDIDAVIDEIFFQTCKSADVNFDGRVTAADLLLIVKLSAGS